MLAITVLSRENTPLGPFTIEQIRERLQSREFTLDHLAFFDGLETWVPLREVLNRVSGKPRTLVPQVAEPTSDGESWSHLPYAGFWVRYVAHVVDELILFVPVMAMKLGVLLVAKVYGVTPLGAHHGVPYLFEDANGIVNSFYIDSFVGVMFISLVIHWLYFSLLESGEAQATVGKKVMKLRVKDEKGRRISFGRATGRYFSKILSGLTIDFGYIMAAFMPRNQALHDIIAGTVVVRR